MVSGVHVVVYSKDAEADRAFFRDILGFRSVDAGHGWLIFALPPAEAAFHPSEEDFHELYFMCDDLTAEIAWLEKKGVKCSKAEERRWGSVAKMKLPVVARWASISLSTLGPEPEMKAPGKCEIERDGTREIRLAMALRAGYHSEYTSAPVNP